MPIFYDQSFNFVYNTYLYRPGKTSDAQSIWNEILGSCEQVCTFEEILKIQEVLDQIAREVESEMERERVLWSIEEVNYENMVSFYETAIDEQKRQGRKSKDKMRRMAEEEDISQQEQLTLQEQQLDELLSMVNEASSNGQVLNSITTTKITIHRHGIMEDVVNNAITRSESDNNQVDIHVRTSGAQYEDNESVSTRTTGSTSTSVSGASTYSNPVSKELMNDLLSCRSGDSISDSITSKRGSSQASRQSKNKSNVDIRPSQQSHIQCDDDDDDENDEEISSNLLSFQKFLQWDFIKVIFTSLHLYLCIYDILHSYV